MCVSIGLACPARPGWPSNVIGFFVVAFPCLDVVHGHTDARPTICHCRLLDPADCAFSTFKPRPEDNLSVCSEVSLATL